MEISRQGKHLKKIPAEFANILHVCGSGKQIKDYACILAYTTIVVSFIGGRRVAQEESKGLICPSYI